MPGDSVVHVCTLSSLVLHAVLYTVLIAYCHVYHDPFISQAAGIVWVDLDLHIVRSPPCVSVSIVKLQSCLMLVLAVMTSRPASWQPTSSASAGQLTCRPCEHWGTAVALQTPEDSILCNRLASAPSIDQH